MPFADESRSRQVKQAARRKLMEFVKKREDDMRRIEEVETRIEFPLQRATIAGKWMSYSMRAMPERSGITKPLIRQRPLRTLLCRFKCMRWV